MKHVVLSVVAAIGLSCGTAGAAEFTLGVGAVEYRDDIGDIQISIEARSEPVAFVLGSDIAPQVGLTVDTAGAAYVGVGAAATNWLSTFWFIEGSLMAGYYSANGDRTDLGSDVEFRSLLGIGREFGQFGRVSLAVSHISHAGIEENNPGANMLSLRLTRGF
ncbi:acyloxyacyl hydrolase [Palleronia abyssalis]|nr:acyloxyacyl hydrolase [Palleronia abyssalis]